MDTPKDDLFPIRELGLRCNVNTVTIRAWERRYGLLAPKRTEKGHRLYGAEDVERVKAILSWMERGVPISQVKTLLDSDGPEEQALQAADWDKPVNDLLRHAKALSHSRIQALLHDHFLNYPAQLCLDKLIEPVMSALISDTQNKVSYHYLQSELVQYAVLRLANKTQKDKSDKIYLACGEKTAIWRLAITAIALDNTPYNIEFLNQAMDVATWLDFATANKTHHCLIYQDGLWRQTDKVRVGEALRDLPLLSLCGSAPLVSGIVEQTQLHDSPSDFLKTLTKTS